MTLLTRHKTKDSPYFQMKIIILIALRGVKFAEGGAAAPVALPLDTPLYGIRGSCHKLLTNYLLKREQYINFKGTDSDVQEAEFGVPQGSVLGPYYS